MDKLDNDIKKIKLARMKPIERFLYKELTKLKETYFDDEHNIYSNKYGEVIKYFKRERTVSISTSNYIIRQIISKYKLSSLDTKTLFKKELKKYFDFKYDNIIFIS